MFVTSSNSTLKSEVEEQMIGPVKPASEPPAQVDIFNMMIGPVDIFYMMIGPYFTILGFSFNDFFSWILKTLNFSILTIH